METLDIWYRCLQIVATCTSSRRGATTTSYCTTTSDLEKCLTLCHFSCVVQCTVGIPEGKKKEKKTKASVDSICKLEISAAIKATKATGINQPLLKAPCLLIMVTFCKKKKGKYY